MFEGVSMETVFKGWASHAVHERVEGERADYKMKINTRMVCVNRLTAALISKTAYA